MAQQQKVCQSKLAEQGKQVEADVEDCKLIPPRVAWQNLPLFEIALVLVRFDHVARLIVNANYST